MGKQNFIIKMHTVFQLLNVSCVCIGKKHREMHAGFILHASVAADNCFMLGTTHYNDKEKNTNRLNKVESMREGESETREEKILHRN